MNARVNDADPYPESRRGEIISALQFRWPWRPYQDRVLKALQSHLHDRKLHVVAAPGSGKTCLGLEVFRQLAGPCVVLSPTRTIRDQWIARLADFLPRGSPSPPEWSSQSLEEPGFLTSLTYQALHSRFRDSADDEEPDSEEEGLLDQPPDKNELKAITRRFRSLRVCTLILDEAHHLRKEWWEALTRLTDGLPQVHIVSLTATPPYDVVGKEWRRYEQLCGPIDEQISVPELVRAGTLCPHQDYVHAVVADTKAASDALQYDQTADEVRTRLLKDDQLLAAVEAHPWLNEENANGEILLDNVELLAAILIYLKSRQRKAPVHLLSLLGCKTKDLPAFGRTWCQTLVQHYLAERNWPLPPELEPHRVALKKSLRDSGLLWRHELRIKASRLVRDRLRLTRSKIAACVEIFRLEHSFRGSGLRQVVLTDFIRDDGKQELGARPIFNALHAAMSPEEHEGLALLTGRVSIVHSSRLPNLDSALQETGRKVETTKLEAYPGFVVVRLGGSRGNLVNAFTRLFSDGRLRVMVGTRALLGEGWDAPAVNSLVIASYVGSYMLTNQMRGRALRTDPRNPTKTSSIWHLVAVEPRTPSGWDDGEELQRRFGTFVGLAASTPSIEAGLQRLSLPPRHEKDWVESVNASSSARLLCSENLGERWRAAIEEAESGKVLPSVETAPDPSLKRTLFRNTLKYLVFSALGAWLTVAMYVAQSVRVDSFRMLMFLLGGAGLAGLFYAGPKLLKAGYLYLRCLPVDGSLKQIGNTLLHGLVEAQAIETDAKRLSVRSKELSPGEFSLALVGGTYYESNVFADSLEELLGPIENPRYLLTRSSGTWPFARKDFHSVPTVLATHKEKAESFLAGWRRRLGPAELIYTRNEPGRRLLLAARSRAFSSAFQPRSRRTDRWH